MADSELSEQDMKSLEALLRKRYDPIKVIPVKENRRAAIIKTSNLVAVSLRGKSRLEFEGKALSCMLTSGAIGNLKRSASESRAIGQVSQ